MLHTGIAIRFSGIELFRKFLAALLIAALACGGTPLAAGRGASQSPDIALIVNNPLDVLDAGPCNLILVPNLPGPDLMTSLREAICVANNTPLAPPGVPHLINFAIPAGLPIMIGAVPGTPGPLPPIITPMIILGPGIVIDGSAAGAGNGLTINNTMGTQIIGLVIQNFVGNGIEINGGGQHTIQNNQIGIDFGGLVPRPNGGDGIQITNSGGNQIGGPAISNVISCNGNNGIEILGLPSVGNKVQGNLIGTDAYGLSPCPNQMDGVDISNAPGNIIGGLNPGNGNVISANAGSGIFIDGVTAASNLIQGNLIGTDINGRRDLGNTGIGIVINKAASNTVGGPTSAARNVISGNNGIGLSITSNTATGNQVYNNLIGTNITGTFAISNTGSGMYIDAPMNLIGDASMGNLISGNGDDGIYIDFYDAYGNQVMGNKIGTDISGSFAIPNQGTGITANDVATTTIGGAATGKGNLISGNDESGVFIDNSSGYAYNNTLQGNKIGTNITGTAAIPNQTSGIWIYDAPFNTIGGSVTGAGNLVSGNDSYGVYIAGDTAHHNLVLGNQIGTNLAGTGAIPNDSAGIFISGAPTNTIGGPGALEGNLVSGNQGGGVYLFSGAYNNRMLGNKIGTVSSGNSALENNNSGVIIQDSRLNTIGGSAAGQGNLISGNDQNGIEITTDVSGGAYGNRVLGNKIGTNLAGSAAVPNEESGISITDVPSNTIGGSGALEGNLISGNLGDGVYIYGSTVLYQAYNNKLLGNKIGTNSSGNSALGNGYSGVYLENAPSNTIGGSAAGEGNLISGNLGSGVEIHGTNARDSKLLGNKIGTNLAGTSAIPNTYSGITLDTVSYTIIGGAAAGQGNLISGNSWHGISISGDDSIGNTVLGNKIGTNQSGSAALENGLHGIFLNYAPWNTIGGTTAGSGNLISGNHRDGVHIANSQARQNVLYGNLIGLSASGTFTIPNESSGIYIQDAISTTIGGIEAGQANTITGNLQAGVNIVGSSALYNRVSGNHIFKNGHLGIDLKDDGVTANDNLDADSGPNGLQNFPMILFATVPNMSMVSIAHTVIAGELNSTISTTFKIEFYSSPSCDPSGYGEGKVFLGAKTVTTNSSGKVDFTFDTNYATTVGEFLTAIAFDPQGNSSEFSNCRRIDAALLYLPLIRK
jgi:hypothetical protein